MKVLIINLVCGIKSSGTICTDIASEFEKNGHEVKIAYGREPYVPEEYKKNAIKVGNTWDVLFHVLKTRLTDKAGFASTKATKKFIKWANDYDPDLLWLHNIHGYFINVDLLFKWIKSRPHMQVKWTLHDCWAFTGHCAYFSHVKCEKWKNHCENCPQLDKYPKSYVDNSYNNYDMKKQLFSNVNNMQIIVPSKWLADLVKDSFLGGYPLVVKHNTINFDIFKPTPSNWRLHYNLSNKYIVLGVASTWDYRKGLEDFLKLEKLLDDKYRIVLVGLSSKQKRNLPKKIIAIKKTNNRSELAKVYSAADVFVNPSKEDVFGMVNLEALACGTPVITYKTVGSIEIIDESCGYVVEKGDIEGLKNKIIDTCNNHTFKKEQCILRAKETTYDIH